MFKKLRIEKKDLLKSLFVLQLFVISLLRSQVNYITTENTSAYPGDTIFINLYMYNPDSAVSGIELSLHYDTVAMQFLNVFPGERIRNRRFNLGYRQGGDSVKILLVSFSGDSIPPDSGKILSLKFVISKNIIADTVLLSLSGVIISSPAGTNLPVICYGGQIVILSPPLKLIISPDTIEPSQTAIIPIHLRNPSDFVRGLQFTISFDHNQVYFDTLINTMGGFTCYINDFTDSIKVVYLSDSNNFINQNTDTIIGILNINVSPSVLPDDSTAVRLLTAISSDTLGNRIPIKTQDGYVGISPENPTILSPSGFLRDTSFSIIWNNVPYAVNFIVEISLDRAFSYFLDSTEISDTLYHLNIRNEGEYFVRVSSVSSRGYRSHWSSVDSFGVDVTPPGDVGLVFPADGGMLNSDSVRFVWRGVVDSVSGVSGYWLEVSNDSLSFGDSVFVADTDTVVVLSDTVWYWRVKAVDVAGNEGGWSEVRMFEVDTHAPEVPTLVSPIGGIWLTDTVVSFRWSEVSLKGKATPVRYILEVNGGVVDTVDSNSCTRVMPEGVYTWRVKAVDLAGNESGWSSIDSFGVDITPPAMPELVGPENGSMLNDSVITFDWSEVEDSTSGVMGYWLELSNDSTFAVGDSVFVSDTDTVMVLGDTIWYWRVRSVDNAGLSSGWTPGWSLTVDTRSPEVPELMSPVGGEWLRDTVVVFEWSEVTKWLKGTAVHYVIEVMEGEDTVVVDTVDTNEVEMEVREGRYRWSVRAYDEAGNSSGWSGVDSFGVDVTSPGVVGLIFPADGGMLNSDSVRFVWSSAIDSVSGVSGYWLEVSGDSSSFGDSVFVSDTDTVMVLGDTIWYWRVKAVDGAGNEGGWSEVRMFEVDTHAPETPTLISPVDSIWLTNDTVNFIWSRVVLKTEKISKSTPVRYVLKLDSSVIDSAISDTSYTIQVPEGLHTWRIRAYDLAGNSSNWSNPGYFGVDITSPVIDSITEISDTVRSVGPWTIHAWVRDNVSGVDSVLLFYQMDPDTQWQEVVMSDSGNGVWIGEIPELTDTFAHSIRYFTKAKDHAGNIALSDTLNFIAIDIEESEVIPGFKLLRVNSVMIKVRGIRFEFEIPRAEIMNFTIYNVTGRKVWKREYFLNRGHQVLVIKPTLRSGLYFLRIRYGGRTYTRKLLVIPTR